MTPVTDAGLASIIKLQPKLRVLHVGRMRTVTDQGLRVLAQLPTLERVVLYRAPKFTREGVATLRLGGCEVILDGGD